MELNANKVKSSIQRMSKNVLAKPKGPALENLQARDRYSKLLSLN